MQFLRSNTATRVTVGPFFGTDGVTPATALTVTNCKLTFIVDTGGVPTLVVDASPTASGGANDMVHITGDDAGFFDLELAAANVNYLGRAKLAITDAANHIPVFHEFMIVSANFYDSMLGTDRIDAELAATPPTANENADALLDRANGIETGYTLRQALRLVASVLLGKSGNGNKTFRDLGDTKDRITATVDGSGNRTAITRDAT